MRGGFDCGPARCSPARSNYFLRLRRQATTPIPAMPAAIRATRLGSGVGAGLPESLESARKQNEQSKAATRTNLMYSSLNGQVAKTEFKHILTGVEMASRICRVWFSKGTSGTWVNMRSSPNARGKEADEPNGYRCGQADAVPTRCKLRAGCNQHVSEVPDRSAPEVQQACLASFARLSTTVVGRSSLGRQIGRRWFFLWFFCGCDKTREG